MLLATEADHIRNFKAIGNLCLVILIDATGSMGDCVDAVKKKLDREMMTELFIR